MASKAPGNCGDGPCDPYIPVGEFFSERAVFITGGTGFLGKVLVEKLLRSCPDVKVIYLLMRPKKGQDVHQRLARLTKCALFDRVRKENPASLEKVKPILGDIVSPELGICQSELNLLIDTVSVVFHSAATVNFDEKLKMAVDVNLVGTKKVMDLCRRMKGLKALVHVSTCYSNCDLEEVQEVIYSPPYDPDSILQCTEWMDDALQAHITPKLLGKHPNTYTLTKALTESAIAKERGNLPVIIVRPSIVTSTWIEPIPGWIESFNGATGVILAAAKGLLRSLVCDGSKVADIVPADVVINVMICAAWWVATSRPDKIIVYNCCTGVKNPIRWKQLRDCMMQNALTICSFEDVLWCPTLSYGKSRVINRIRQMLFQHIPAYVIDAFFRMSGKKPMLVDVQTKIVKGTDLLEFFTTHQWRFVGNNIDTLSKNLSPEDASKFQLDVRGMNWKDYLISYLLGMRSTVCGEDPQTLPRCISQHRRLLWLHRSVQFFLLLLFGYLLTCLLSSSVHSLKLLPFN